MKGLTVGEDVHKRFKHAWDLNQEPNQIQQYFTVFLQHKDFRKQVTAGITFEASAEAQRWTQPMIFLMDSFQLIILT